MHPLKEKIKGLDKHKLLIYLFSYAIYLVINKSFSNSVLYLLNEDSFRQRWTTYSVPCGDSPTVFLILFQIFKILLFILFLRNLNRDSKGYISEFFTAYFIYDFVYLLSFIWNLIPVPVNLYTWWLLNSSGQIFLSRYLPHLDLIFAGLWTTALLIALHRKRKLSLKFLIHRIAIIPFSVPLVFLIIYLLAEMF